MKINAKLNDAEKVQCQLKLAHYYCVLGVTNWFCILIYPIIIYSSWYLSKFTTKTRNTELTFYFNRFLLYAHFLCWKLSRFFGRMGNVVEYPYAMDQNSTLLQALEGKTDFIPLLWAGPVGMMDKNL